MPDGQKFCRDCGGEAAAPRAKAAASSSSSSSSAELELEPAKEWKAGDCWPAAAGVELAIAWLNPEDEDGLESEEIQRINERAAAVANKHFRSSGRWKEEIALAVTVAGCLFPAAYAGLISGPRKKRAAERERIKLLEKRAAASEGLRSVPPANVQP